ncbi:MAG: hypothetical protein NZM26_04100 [Patescibacteria group bacterium]|nr:hypothetical protein [Patescibacteria group bacterium]
MPSAESLKEGVNEIAVFVENERKGIVTLSKLKAGFAGKRQLAQALEQYEQSGIAINIFGLKDEEHFNLEILDNGLFQRRKTLK